MTLMEHEIDEKHENRYGIMERLNLGPHSRAARLCWIAAEVGSRLSVVL